MTATDQFPPIRNLSDAIARARLCATQARPRVPSTADALDLLVTEVGGIPELRRKLRAAEDRATTAEAQLAAADARVAELGVLTAAEEWRIAERGDDGRPLTGWGSVSAAGAVNFQANDRWLVEQRTVHTWTGQWERVTH